MVDSADIFQQLDLYRIRSNQIETRSKLRKGENEVDALRDQIDKMALINQALYDLLKKHVGITDEELRRKVRELDVSDGVEDGRLRSEPLECPKCGAVVTAGALKCYSCGATIAPSRPFNA